QPIHTRDGKVMTKVVRSRHAVTPLIAVVALALFSFGPASHKVAQDCPAGYKLAQAGAADPDKVASTEADAPTSDQGAQPRLSLTDKPDERAGEHNGLGARRSAAANAPYGGVPDHAFSTAMAQRNKLFAQG